MTPSVLTWKQAKEKGYLPRQYDYLPGQLPGGWLVAVLDFKMWADKVLAINGYFTLTVTGKQIQLSVYLSATGSYRVGRGTVDFFRCPVGCSYRLLTGLTARGKLALKDITEI
ncbi:hypothetical protein [Paraflavitalea pollutisoli]|uniref:hypothetical protein n=1 Tax=Paraflavitalea pollutisoli TaxID=3034143 RepID=UPI0023EE2026|nr:hypothetical protein [Paraflavitalea sp. H1-2-19X]